MKTFTKGTISAIALIIAAGALINGQTILGSICVIIACAAWLIPKARARE